MKYLMIFNQISSDSFGSVKTSRIQPQCLRKIQMMVNLVSRTKLLLTVFFSEVRVLIASFGFNSRISLET